MKTAITLLVLTLSVCAAHAQAGTAPSTVPTNSPGVASPDITPNRMNGAVIGTPATGKSRGDTGPVSLATPSRPLYSGPNAEPQGDPTPPSMTGAVSASRSGKN